MAIQNLIQNLMQRQTPRHRQSPCLSSPLALGGGGAETDGEDPLPEVRKVRVVRQNSRVRRMDPKQYRPVQAI